MSEVTSRRRLARGTKLCPEHIHGHLDNIATQINNVNVDRGQMQAKWAPFRVSFHLPYLDIDFFDYGLLLNHEPSRPWSIPFTLPPLQEYMDITASVGDEPPSYTREEDVPQVILDEVSFSFDQRAEPCTIVSALNGAAPLGDSADQGKMDFDNIDDRLNLKIALVEKKSVYFGGGLDPERQIFSADLPSDFFNGADLRLNPFIVGDLNVNINPYSTLVFLIYADDLSDQPNAEHSALCSIQVSMRFRHELVPRDTWDGVDTFTQNLPTTPHKAVTHSGHTPRSISIRAAVGGDVIQARDDGATAGVATNMYAIDKVFQEKFRGGYNEYSEVANQQEILDDAGYDVICVPLFQNRKHGGVVSATADQEPYMDPTNVLADRRYIPIPYPITIHHVVLAWNWMPWDAVQDPAPVGAVLADTVPAEPNFTASLGVGIGTGHLADNYAYEQVAYLEINGPRTVNWGTNQIDRVRINRNNAINASVEHMWDWELHQVPLVYQDHTGVGHYTQGQPFFVGQGRTGTELRTDVDRDIGPGQPDIDPGYSATAGAEQFLEVRLHITDDDGDLWTPVQNIIAGYGGHYVYIIGKKHMVWE